MANDSKDQTTPGTGDEEPKKKSLIGKLIVPVIGLALAGGGGFATYSGMIDLPFIGGDSAASEGKGGGHGGDMAGINSDLDTAFIALPPMVIPLGEHASARHLRAILHIETSPEEAAQVTLLQPRILDVLNTYLRAVEERDLETPTALSRLRAQMLRRVRLVAGAHRINDLLISEFVLQ